MADQLTFDLPGMGRIVERHVAVSGTLTCVEAQPARTLGWGDRGVALVSWEVRSLGIVGVPRAAGDEDSLLKVGVTITELHALDESQQEAFEAVLATLRAKAAGGWSDDEDRPALRGIA